MGAATPRLHQQLARRLRPDAVATLDPLVPILPSLGGACSDTAHAVVELLRELISNIDQEDGG